MTFLADFGREGYVLRGSFVRTIGWIDQPHPVRNKRAYRRACRASAEQLFGLFEKGELDEDVKSRIEDYEVGRWKMYSESMAKGHRGFPVAWLEIERRSEEGAH